MAQRNFLLGKGERLTTDIVVKRGGRPKEEPYTIEEARARLAPMLAGAAAIIDGLPRAGLPERRSGHIPHAQSRIHRQVLLPGKPC